MFARTILLTVLAATCGATDHPSEDGPDDITQEEVRPIDQHFCCSEVASTKPLSGEGCVAIGKESINSCEIVLYCAADWLKEGGTVTCL
ncbi:hypothetical protein [Enhygromyxa salina]|uniref:Uncharacterized protein n=1 Tax=Enhygromyxa salina TaxID=215803 RepID=A0A2S9YLI5_9BACT|nr:hypothetical protein [Enhygromyxa salina]PRQ05965.1 hypothetical protein ENSA7_43260 [Enhygromyxa salina]